MQYIQLFFAFIALIGGILGWLVGTLSLTMFLVEKTKKIYLRIGVAIVVLSFCFTVLISSIPLFQWAGSILENFK